MQTGKGKQSQILYNVVKHNSHLKQSASVYLIQCIFCTKNCPLSFYVRMCCSTYESTIHTDLLDARTTYIKMFFHAHPLFCIYLPYTQLTLITVVHSTSIPQPFTFYFPKVEVRQKDAETKSLLTVTLLSFSACGIQITWCSQVNWFPEARSKQKEGCQTFPVFFAHSYSHRQFFQRTAKNYMRILRGSWLRTKGFLQTCFKASAKIIKALNTCRTKQIHQ